MQGNLVKYKVWVNFLTGLWNYKNYPPHAYEITMKLIFKEGLKLIVLNLKNHMLLSLHQIPFKLIILN